MAPIATADLTNLVVSKSPNNTNPAIHGARTAEIEDSNILYLQDIDVYEIEQAAAAFEASGAPLNQLSKQSFPLPSLSKRLLQAKAQVCNGDGYVLLRGLDSHKYSPSKNVIIFTGLTSYFGGKRAMTGYADGSRSVLQHITEARLLEERDIRCLANQNESIPTHTDRGDIVALYTLSTSLAGGRFYLADIDRVFARLSDTARSEVMKPWVQIDPTSSTGSATRPLVFYRNSSSRSHLLVNFTHVFLTGTSSQPRPSHLPPLSDDQLGAIQELHQRAKECATWIDFLPGDLVMFDNLRLMHARDSFIDDASIGRKRHLMRLIVKLEGAPNMRPVPSELDEMYKGLFSHEVELEELDIQPELFTLTMGP